MIIVKLKGGIGNQMFQYALAKKIENITDQKVYFDLSFKQVSSETPRQYAISCFEASYSIISINNKQLPLIFRNPPGDFLKKIFQIFRQKGYFKSKKWNYITENNYSKYDLQKPILLNLYFDGYWQSEKYFREIRDLLISEFTLKNISSELFAVSRKMKTEDSVSIHIRHGDYLSNEITNNYHGICSPEYYLQALKIIQLKISNPIFYIFSDDIEWAANFFSSLNMPFLMISGQNFTDCEELFLMTKCRHQIIANSSFSWWGAWLNTHPEKIVISPAKWFNIAVPDVEFIPTNWILI